MRKIWKEAGSILFVQGDRGKEKGIHSGGIGLWKREAAFRHFWMENDNFVRTSFGMVDFCKMGLLRIDGIKEKSEN